MDQAFNRALAFVLEREGGWYDGKNPRDPNPTMKGIIQRTYDQWRAVRALPRRSVREIEQSELEAIYHDDYWILSGAARQVDPKLQLVVFDCGVNQGVGVARELVEVTDDPRIYLQCRAALYRYICLKRPAKRANLNGWLNRLDECAAEIGVPGGIGRRGGGRRGA